VREGRAQLEAVLRLENETERRLAVAALIDDVVRELGFRAIVIGGVAVEFGTRGACSTADSCWRERSVSGHAQALALHGRIREWREVRQ
jgi:hypothetical protein